MYSRMILDCLVNESIGDTPNIGGMVFNIVVHVSKTEMIEYGKYYSVVSA